MYTLYRNEHEYDGEKTIRTSAIIPVGASVVDLLLKILRIWHLRQISELIVELFNWQTFVVIEYELFWGVGIWMSVYSFYASYCQTATWLLWNVRRCTICARDWL